MSNVISSELPQQSWLYERHKPTDFLDCYSVDSNMSPRRAAEVITTFPGWARLLLLVRGVLVAPFGLSKDGPEADDKVGIFPVVRETDHELIAGFDDRHLNFRVSVIARNGRVFLSTWVHPHNLGGRIYLRAVLPFHILIVREALGRVSRESTSAGLQF